MAQPRQQERRPAEVTVPRISPEETALRAGRAFDSSLVGMLRQYFRGPPPAAEMAQFRQAVNDALRDSRPGETVDVGGIADRFARDNPESVFARYMRFSGGSTGWIFNGDTGQVAFSQSTLTRDVTGFFAGARRLTVDALVNLSNPQNRSQPVNLGTVDLVLDTRHIPPARRGDPEQIVEVRAASVIHSGLSAQISRGQNQVPATATFDQSVPRILLASLLPPPDTSYDFQKKK
ncbi:MAG: hypothetical protein U0R44_07335 [Candidatus Micrarchaeia archaeon]